MGVCVGVGVGAGVGVGLGVGVLVGRGVGVGVGKGYDTHAGFPPSHADLASVNAIQGGVGVGCGVAVGMGVEVGVGDGVAIGSGVGAGVRVGGMGVAVGVTFSSGIEVGVAVDSGDAHPANTINRRLQTTSSERRIRNPPAAWIEGLHRRSECHVSRTGGHEALPSMLGRLTHKAAVPGRRCVGEATVSVSRPQTRDAQ